MLSIAYASNFGGISTIIGTPPNVAYVSFISNKYGFDIPFLSWMLLCTPIAILLLLSLYLLLINSLPILTENICLPSFSKNTLLFLQ
jgi:sodium-dependent dicarboxylate transporter 2/3/5